MAILVTLELGFKAVKRNLIVGGLWQWPLWKKRSMGESAEEWHLELWQELEQDPAMQERLRQIDDDECNQGLPEVTEQAVEDVDMDVHIERGH